jgi:hypothetical protein
MAALVATRHNPILATFYQRLRAAGKPLKLALTATMRKLLLVLNSALRSHPTMLELKTVTNGCRRTTHVFDGYYPTCAPRSLSVAAG